jgi:hypothetical protein
MRTVAPLIGSGYVVLLPDGVQAVVRHARDGEPVEVVRTGGDRVSEFFDADLLTVVPTDYPRVMNCTGCGDVWRCHGDRTSHCPAVGCHQTFEGGTLWDAHRVQGADGKFVCLPGAVMTFQGARLTKVADPAEGLVTVGTWRGPKMKAGVFA